MKVTMEIDEARVFKLAMEGLTKKQIEEKLAAEIRIAAMDTVRSRISDKVNEIADELAEKSFHGTIAAKLTEEIHKYMTPERITKEFRKETWSDLFDNVVTPVLTDFLSYGLQEWLTLEIGIRGKGKDGKTAGSVTVVGTESYEHRKK